MLLKPTRTLDNKNHIIEMAGLLLDLKKEMYDKFEDYSDDDIQWALEQAIMRLSIKDGHDYGITV